MRWLCKVIAVISPVFGLFHYQFVPKALEEFGGEYVFLNDKAMVLQQFKARIAEMKQKYGNRLLVWNVKYGWKPLCQFLDVPIPNCEFPRTNDSDALKSTVIHCVWLVLRRNAFQLLVCFSLFTVTLVILCTRLYEVIY